MDIWGLFWQILAYGALLFLLIVIIFAIIEPGPLQKRRTFGQRRGEDPGDEPTQNEPSTESTAEAQKVEAIEVEPKEKEE
jgi:hypothetical protein